MRRIGIEPGKSFDISQTRSRPCKKGSRRARRRPPTHEVEGADHSKGRQLLVNEHRHDGRIWELLPEARHRSAVGLGANLPEDAIYPLNLGDAERQTPRRGEPVHDSLREGRHSTGPRILVHHALRSDGFQVANVLNRFAVSSWMPFKYNQDGSLDLYFQSESPGKDKEANWLPAPKAPFNLTMRLYSPQADALTGKWNPPPIKKL